MYDSSSLFCCFSSTGFVWQEIGSDGASGLITGSPIQPVTCGTSCFCDVKLAYNDLESSVHDFMVRIQPNAAVSPLFFSNNFEFTPILHMVSTFREPTQSFSVSIYSFIHSHA